MGDFNAHHFLWGSNKCCKNGETMAEVLDLDEFFLLNNFDPTHYHYDKDDESLKYSNIDLAFTSMELVTKSYWRVLDDPWNSDHFPICIEIGIEPEKINRQSFKYNKKQIVWENFENNLLTHKESFQDLHYTNSNALERYNNFVEVLDNSILNAYKNKSKSRQNTRNNNSSKKMGDKKIWWNNECEKMVRQRKALFKSLKYRCNLEKIINYKKICAETTNFLKNTKKNSFREFAESINSSTTISNVWHKIKIFKNGFNKSISSLGNIKFQQNASECLEDLCVPKGSTIETFDMDAYESSSPYKETLLKPFSFEEFETALNSFRLDSAPGKDKFTYEILIFLPEFFKRVLLDIYNDIFHFGLFPNQWSEYLIIFIPKNNSSKARPISLASCLLKLFEKLINYRLTWFIEHNQLIPNFQFGFRKDKSCMDNLTILVNDIHKAFFKDENLIAAFLDIKGAYDSIIPDLMLKDLAELNLPKQYLIFFKNLLFERYLTPVNLTNSNSTKYKVEIGLPQGCGTSPNLFSIYSKFKSEIISDSCKILQFADDIVVYSSNKDSSQAIEQLENTIDKLFHALKGKNLSIAPDKCNVVIFNKKKKKEKNIKIKINNKDIKPSDNVKFLGLILDRNLSWRPHIKNLEIKCNAAVRIIKCLRGIWWGADPNILLTIYKALVRSKIEYGGFLISPCKEIHMNKLQKIQNSSLRFAMGYQCTTPINVIMAESCIPYLKYRFEYLGYKYILKNLSYPSNSVINSIEEVYELSENPVYQINFEKSLIVQCYEQSWFKRDLILNYENYYKFSLPYDSSFYKPICDYNSSKPLQKFKNAENKFNSLFSNNNSIDIFTDGSKINVDNKSYVGFALWSKIEFFRKQFKLPDLASIFTAECYAIIVALNSIIEWRKENQFREFRIFTDSQSIVKALSFGGGFGRESPLLVQARDNMFQAMNLGIEIKIIWIPSHKGILGNEMVDEAAKNAAMKENLMNVAIPFSDIIPTYKQICYKKNQEELIKISENKGNFYFENFYNYNKKPWFSTMFNLPRKTITFINRLRSNHTLLNNSLFKYKIVNSDLCKCGKEADTADHIFWHCDLYTVERKIMIRKLNKLKLYGPFSIYSLVLNLNISVIEIISEFIFKSKINI